MNDEITDYGDDLDAGYKHGWMEGFKAAKALAERLVRPEEGAAMQLGVYATREACADAIAKMTPDAGRNAPNRR